MRQQYNDTNLYQTEKTELFDVNYIAMLTILSVILDAYGLSLNEKQNYDNVYMSKTIDRIEKHIEKLDSKIDRVERMLERSVYYGK